jgi:hypothetical protein
VEHAIRSPPRRLNGQVAKGSFVHAQLPTSLRLDTFAWAGQWAARRAAYGRTEKWKVVAGASRRLQRLHHRCDEGAYGSQ